MDCDTTGVEPDIALVKYKKLVGGGLMKIVNTTVPMALSKLGYTAPEIEAIVHHIDEQETIEGAPFLKDEHLPVFDCAFKAANGERSIHYMWPGVNGVTLPVYDHYRHRIETRDDIPKAEWLSHDDVSRVKVLWSPR